MEMGVESQPVKGRLGDWCEMAASLGVVQLSVDRESVVRLLFMKKRVS
jgi:hypothetical protein